MSVVYILHEFLNYVDEDAMGGREPEKPNAASTGYWRCRILYWRDEIVNFLLNVPCSLRNGISTRVGQRRWKARTLMRCSICDLTFSIVAV